MMKQIREFGISLAAAFGRESGIAETAYRTSLIVSLTSYGARFDTLHLTLESLLRQALKPNKIVLWIAENEIALLPYKVARLQRRGLTIAACPDYRSFKKIIPSLRAYPQTTIVTADDDVIYPATWLKALYEAHLAHPGEIVCHRARHITFSPRGEVNSYELWPNLGGEHSGLLIFPIGVGGVLYPPESLHADVDNVEAFQSLCAHGDDIWLKAMSVMRGVKCRKISTFKKHFRQVQSAQKISLKSENMLSRNDEQIARVFSRYGIDDLLKTTEPG